MHDDEIVKPLTKKEEEALRAQKIENEDLNFDAIWKGIGWFFVFTVAGIVVVGLMYQVWYPSDPQSALPVSEKRLPQDLRLQTNTTVITDMNEVRKKETELLNTYGWVDKKEGIVHIPISVAKEEVLKSLNGAKGSN